jgi:hypothetical protein
MDSPTLKSGWWMLVLCACAATPGRSSADAEDQILCPEFINVDQKLKETPKGWTSDKEETPFRLMGVAFFDGPPKDLAMLAPDSQVEGNSPKATWRLPKGKARYVSCQYDRTNVTLIRQLDDALSRCEVSYDPNLSVAGREVIRSIVCK